MAVERIVLIVLIVLRGPRVVVDPKGHVRRHEKGGGVASVEEKGRWKRAASTPSTVTVIPHE